MPKIKKKKKKKKKKKEKTEHLCWDLGLQHQERGLQSSSLWDVKLHGERQKCQGDTCVQVPRDFAEKPPNNCHCVRLPPSLLAQLSCVKILHVGTAFQREILESFSRRQCWNIRFDHFSGNVSWFQFEVILVKWFILHLKDDITQGQAWFKIHYLDPFFFLFRMFICAHFENLGLVQNWNKNKTSSIYYI